MKLEQGSFLLVSLTPRHNFIACVCGHKHEKFVTLGLRGEGKKILRHASKSEKRCEKEGKGMSEKNERGNILLTKNVLLQHYYHLNMA
jgi:hypothetical protein